MAENICSPSKMRIFTGTRLEVEEFHKQFGGEFVANEQDSPYATKYQKLGDA